MELGSCTASCASSPLNCIEADNGSPKLERTLRLPNAALANKGAATKTVADNAFGNIFWLNSVFKMIPQFIKNSSKTIKIVLHKMSAKPHQA